MWHPTPIFITVGINKIARPKLPQHHLAFFFISFSTQTFQYDNRLHIILVLRRRLAHRGRNLPILFYYYSKTSYNKVTKNVLHPIANTIIKNRSKAHWKNTTAYDLTISFRPASSTLLWNDLVFYSFWAQKQRELNILYSVWQK